MSHPDEVTAKSSGVEFTPHPDTDNPYAMVCVDCINLGDRLRTFQGKNPRLSPSVAFVFQSGARNPAGQLHEVTKEFTVSMSPKSALRAFLGQWLGKALSEEQAKAGVPLHKLVGRTALISVEVRTSAAGRQYANIASISPLPKAMAAPELPPYERPAFFAGKVQRYAEEAAAFKATRTPGATALTTESYADMPAGLEDDDSGLPF